MKEFLAKLLHSMQKSCNCWILAQNKCARWCLCMLVLKQFAAFKSV